MIKKAKAIKKMILAKVAAPAAIPPNPKIPAKIAIIKNAIDSLNMSYFFNEY